MGFLLLGVNRGCFLVMVHRLLIVVASLVAEHRLEECRLQKLEHVGSVVVAHGLSCSMACGIFPDQGLNPYSLHWQADSSTVNHQGSPSYAFHHVLVFP